MAFFGKDLPRGLAAAVIEFRDGVGGRRGSLFHSPEDLLRVPGISRGIYEACEELHHGW